MGMTYGAMEVKYELSNDQARQLFMPAKNIESSRGNLYDGYKTPTRYKNISGGDVTIDYEKRSQNLGKISVEATGGPGLTFDKFYDINLPTLQI